MPARVCCDVEQRAVKCYPKDLGEGERVEIEITIGRFPSTTQQRDFRERLFLDRDMGRHINKEKGKKSESPEGIFRH